MTCYSDKPLSYQNRRLFGKVDTLQRDLLRLSNFITQLAGLSEEELTALVIADPLDGIHRCLNRLERCCLASQLTTYSNESFEPFIDETSEVNALPKRLTIHTIKGQGERLTKPAKYRRGD